MQVIAGERLSVVWSNAQLIRENLGYGNSNLWSWAVWLLLDPFTDQNTDMCVLHQKL